MKKTITETAEKMITCVRKWLEYAVAEIKSSYSHLKKGEFNKSLPLLMAGVLLVTVLLIVIIAAASSSCRKTAEDDILSEGQTYQTVVSGDYEYYVDTDRAVIVSYKGQVEKLTVPAEIDGFPVIGIGDGAFDGCDIKRVTVSEGIEFIGKASFSNCTQMVSIDLPDSLTKIGNYCFKGCSGLEYLYIPQNVTELDTNSFENCPSLLGFTVDEANKKYRSINGVLCYDVSYNNDPDIYLGHSPEYIDRSIIRCPEKMAGDFSMSCVMSVYSGAFKDCVNITSITISGSLNYGCGIYERAFEGCTSLEHVTLDGMVLSIGDGAFVSCHSLKRIDVALSNSYYSSVDGVLFSKDFTELICCPANVECDNSNRYFDSYIVPLGTTDIAPFAFDMFSGSKVYISPGVTSIGAYAFSNMSDETECAPLPKSAVNVSPNAFEIMPDKSEDMDNPNGAHWAVDDLYALESVGVLFAANHDGYTGVRGEVANKDGYMCVWQNGRVGIIDSEGKCVVPTVFDMVYWRDDGSICAVKNGQHSIDFYDSETYVLSDDGGIVLETEHEERPNNINEFTGTCWTTPIWCEDEQKMYVADVPDSWPGEDDLIEFGYSGVTAAEYYSSLDEFLSIDLAAWWNDPPEEKYVLISNGKRVSDYMFEDACAYSGGLIAMQKDGKWGYLDKNGEVIFDFKYDGILVDKNYYSFDSYEEALEDGLVRPYDASDGYVVLYSFENNEYALYRTDGTKEIEWGSMILRPVHNGKLWAGYDDVWGVLELD